MSTDEQVNKNFEGILKKVKTAKQIGDKFIAIDGTVRYPSIASFMPQLRFYLPIFCSNRGEDKYDLEYFYRLMNLSNALIKEASTRDQDLSNAPHFNELKQELDLIAQHESLANFGPCKSDYWELVGFQINKVSNNMVEIEVNYNAIEATDKDDCTSSELNVNPNAKESH